MTPAGARPAHTPAGRGGRDFVLNVRSLRARPGSRHEVRMTGPLPGLFVSGSRVPEESDVCFEGTVESTLGGVVLSGTVTAPFVGTCRRCLEEAAGCLRAEVRELCRDAEDVAAEGDDPDESYLVGRDELDVEAIVRDACILELPLAPLCRESCRGLCPGCGADLNKDECSCAEGAAGPFSVLAGLVPGPGMEAAAAERDAEEGSDDGRSEEEDVEVEEP